MSGGIAYVYDVQKSLANGCNTEMVDLDPLEAADFTFYRRCLKAGTLYR
jgi:glutamate synthase (NADPH/NADH) large chain